MVGFIAEVGARFLISRAASLTLETGLAYNVVDMAVSTLLDRRVSAPKLEKLKEESVQFTGTDLFTGGIIFKPIWKVVREIFAEFKAGFVSRTAGCITGIAVTFLMGNPISYTVAIGLSVGGVAAKIIFNEIFGQSNAQPKVEKKPA